MCCCQQPLMDDPFLHNSNPGRSVFLANLLVTCHCNANVRRLWGLAGWAGHSSVLILNLCINASPSTQRVGCYAAGRGNASASLIFNLCKNTFSPGSLLPSFLTLPLSFGVIRDRQQERRKAKEISPCVSSTTLGGLSHFRVCKSRIPLWTCEPLSARGVRGALGLP